MLDEYNERDELEAEVRLELRRLVIQEEARRRFKALLDAEANGDG